MHTPHGTRPPRAHPSTCGAAYLLVVHAFAIAYTDLFEATIFGGGIGRIGALLTPGGRADAAAAKQQ